VSDLDYHERREAQKRAAARFARNPAIGNIDRGRAQALFCRPCACVVVLVLIHGAMEAETFRSVFDALADTEAEAANMKARAELLLSIRDRVNSWRVPQDQAASRLGITRPRLNDLLRGKLTKFSLDALVNIASAAHLAVEIRVQEAA
jgi:predicted XRE-type DNA-binding protein